MVKHVNKGRVGAKADLPTKTCVACGRPFAWRAKWARDWEGVRYCSDRCRRAGPADQRPPSGPG